MPLSPSQLARVERMYRDQWSDEAELGAFFDSITDPEELHIYADHFNWDGGVNELRKVIRHPLCDRGTALMIYWRGGPGLKAVFDEKPHHHRTREATDKFELLMEIEQLMLNGRWKSQQIPFDPHDDRGKDHVRALESLPKKRMPPPEMFEPMLPTLRP